jgi:hypothetical protein
MREIRTSGSEGGAGREPRSYLYPAKRPRKFHRKMKLIQRRAYGFRNFENYRLRVIAQCG